MVGFARGFYESRDAEVQLAATETIEATDLSPLVPRITAPVLLLAGQEDNMTPCHPAESGVGMTQIHTMLPGCGDYLVIEQPQAACDAIGRFVLGAASGNDNGKRTPARGP